MRPDAQFVFPFFSVGVGVMLADFAAVGVDADVLGEGEEEGGVRVDVVVFPLGDFGLQVSLAEAAGVLEPVAV